MIDTGSHWLRPLRIWLGEVDEVVAALGHPNPAMEGESLCRALLRFDSGAIAVFDAMLTTGAIAHQPLFTVTGTTGELTIEGTGWVKCWDGTDWKGTQGRRARRIPPFVRAELADFVSAVQRGTAPAAPPTPPLVSCGSRSRCTARPKRSSGRRSGHERRDVRLHRHARARHRRHVGHRSCDRARIRERRGRGHGHRNPRRRLASTTPTSHRSRITAAG